MVPLGVGACSCRDGRGLPSERSPVWANPLLTKQNCKRSLRLAPVRAKSTAAATGYSEVQDEEGCALFTARLTVLWQSEGVSFAKAGCIRRQGHHEKSGRSRRAKKPRLHDHACSCCRRNRYSRVRSSQDRCRVTVAGVTRQARPPAWRGRRLTRLSKNSSVVTAPVFGTGVVYCAGPSHVPLDDPLVRCQGLSHYVECMAI